MAPNLGTAPAFSDLAFDANVIFVHGGTFSVGSESRPFMNQLTITLHGDRFSGVEIPIIGTKCLAVMDTGVSSAGAPEFSPAGSSNSNNSLASSTTNRLRAFSRGSIDIHGAPRRRAWALLAADVTPGSSM